MRKISLLILFTALTAAGICGNWTGISSSSPVAGKVRLISSTIDRSTVQITLGGFFLREVQTPAGQAFVVEMENATPLLEAGAPDLPKMTTSLVIPDQAGMSVNVIASEYRDYPGILIAPSKGVISRDVDPASLPYAYGECYQKDAFYPATVATTRDPYIVRNVRGQTIILNPFRYNPVTKTLRVLYNLTVELVKTSETGINPLAAAPTRAINGEFRAIFQHRFLNFDAMSYTPLEEYGNLLVICYGPFMEAMQPYVNWKLATGYPTEMVSKDSVGTTAAQIKSYIANYYNTKGLTHVLLVGDSPQIPTNTGSGLGGPSDNAYGYIIGSDHYSDVFIGRFSAENVAQVQTQVQRTLEYEQNPQFTSDDWYSTVIGIASDQGPGDDNEYDYQHVRNQQTQCLNYTYTMNPELFDGSQGGNDAPGNPTPPLVATEVNNGASLILYTGHGSNNSWGTSGFSNNNVNQLTNVGKLPFIWSVACVNGNFTAGTCFAEAWLRASQGGQPTGAIAFLGSTINQSWNSPMEGQDEMTNILTESDSTNIKRTFAGLSINGCMKMIESYGSDGMAMADTWTIFGDPTIMVRTAAPMPLAAQYDTLLFVGDSTLEVTCSVPGARVTATLANTILATGVAGDNPVTLTFPPLTNPSDTIRLVVTAYNMIPLQGYLVVRDVPAPVVAGFTGTPTRVVPGHTVAFADTSNGNTNAWTWHFPGGTPEISHEKNPVIAYETIGTYDVTLVTGDGFTSDSTTVAGYIVVDFPAGAAELPASLGFTVSPNPSTGILYLNLNSPAPDLLSVSVYDLTGKRIYGDEAVSITGRDTKVIDLTSFPDGIYFINVSGKKEAASRRVILKR